MTTGPESTRFDSLMASFMPPATRAEVWSAAADILGHGPLSSSGSNDATGLALGYVQSGKTTSITALLALAADQGYRVIIALLGSTNLLLDQNTGRIEDAVTGGRKDYKWSTVRDARGRKSAQDIDGWIRKDRVVLLPLLKHAKRISDLRDVLAASNAREQPVLIVDDEADQASLNTSPSENEMSKTYAALTGLREVLPRHIYVQYTATPYAPLLLDLEDQLKPEFVTLLHPGPGYTGGREFFVDHADTVIRTIPAQDEQATKALPLRLPKSLESALANFIVGAAALLALPEPIAPVSMLIHSTQRNDVQARYQFLVDRQLRKWGKEVEQANGYVDVPHVFRDEWATLLSAGAEAPEPAQFLPSINRALREATTWLVNSTSAMNSIQWNSTPVHILVGGNKLDRGFTVEGLTVTYMNRPASPQIDTLEQRARAFGYRRSLLPYCQFFATPRTLGVLRDIVFTEYDLRAQLRDVLDAGGTVDDWATQVGLILPAGAKPTRSAVIGALQRFSSSGSSWISLRRPSLEPQDLAFNATLVDELGILDATRTSFERLAFRTVAITNLELVDLVAKWRVSSYSPGWRRDELVEHLSRSSDPSTPITAVLMDDQHDGPRVRSWDELGFVNLFQGRDTRQIPGQPFYPGDQAVPHGPDIDQPSLQIHVVSPRQSPQTGVYTLAVKLTNRQIVKRMNRE